MSGEGESAGTEVGAGAEVGERARPRSGHIDPQGEAPWAMQIVTRIEKTDPPTRTAVCEASAMAVVTLLTDPRCAPDGEWHDDVQRWLSGRIRKHARRARGVAWERVQTLPGVTVAHSGAEVRVFPPCPVDVMPRELAKLQLSGGELDDPEPMTESVPVRGGPVLVAITPEPALPLGKAAAAAGHASQLAAAQMDPARLKEWAEVGFRVQALHPTPAGWHRFLTNAQVVIRDAGFTAVAPGTRTAAARWL
jgi:hypothetical protein